MVFRVGAHVSIAGGFSNVPARIRDVGGNCGQIFVHAPQNWRFSELDDEDVVAFRKEYLNGDFRPIVVHSSYLPNLASPNPKLFYASVNMLKKELERCKLLGLEFLNFHPGAHVGSGIDAGVKSIVKGINKLSSELSKEHILLLENTAGKGTTIGRSLDELKRIIEGVDTSHIGVCIDTQHTFASGYAIHTEEGLDNFLSELDDKIGLRKVKAIHLNDSLVEFDSQKDRHQHIGLGELGETAIRRIINHKLLRDKPFILETPCDDIRDHAENIKAAKRLRT